MSKSLKSGLRCWFSKCDVSEGRSAIVEWFLQMGEQMDRDGAAMCVNNGMMEETREVILHGFI